MVGLLVLGLVLVHFAGRSGKKVSKDDAIAISRAEIDFVPTGYQIRFLRRGIPPRGYWITSYYIQKPTGGYSRVTVVVIDARTGRVTEVRKET